MNDERSPSTLIVILAVAVGLVVGAALAVWLVRWTSAAPHRGEPASQVVSPDLQVVLAHGAEPPIGLVPATPAAEGQIPGGEIPGGQVPKVLLVALPDFEPPHRAFLFIRPADPRLCRRLQGIELAVFGDGSDPIGLCAVGEPAPGDGPVPAVETIVPVGPVGPLGPGGPAGPVERVEICALGDPPAAAVALASVEFPTRRSS